MKNNFCQFLKMFLFSIKNQPAPSAEMWQWVHSFYGEELGLTSDDEPDYISPFIVSPSTSALLVNRIIAKMYLGPSKKASSL